MASVEQQARELLEHYCDTCGSQRAAAKRLRISPQYVNDLLQGKRDVPDRLLRRLGYRYDVQMVRLTP